MDSSPERSIFNKSQIVSPSKKSSLYKINYEHYIEIDENIQLIEELIQNSNKRAMDLLKKENYLDALTFLRKSEQILQNEYEKVQNNFTVNRLIAITYNNLGCYYRKENKEKVAVKYFQEALKLKSYNIQEAGTVSGVHLNLCAVLSSMELHELAQRHAQQSLELQKLAYDHHLQKEVTQKVRDMIQQGEYQRASRLDSKVRVIIKTKLISFYNMAFELEFLKDYNKCIDILKESLELAKCWLNEESQLYENLKNLHDRVRRKNASWKKRENKLKRDIHSGRSNSGSRKNLTMIKLDSYQTDRHLKETLKKVVQQNYIQKTLSPPQRIPQKSNAFRINPNIKSMNTSPKRQNVQNSEFIRDGSKPSQRIKSRESSNDSTKNFKTIDSNKEGGNIDSLSPIKEKNIKRRLYSNMISPPRSINNKANNSFLKQNSVNVETNRGNKFTINNMNRLNQNNYLDTINNNSNSGEKQRTNAKLSPIVVKTPTQEDISRKSFNKPVIQRNTSRDKSIDYDFSRRIFQRLHQLESKVDKYTQQLDDIKVPHHSGSSQIINMSFKRDSKHDAIFQQQKIDAKNKLEPIIVTNQESLENEDKFTIKQYSVQRDTISSINTNNISRKRSSAKEQIKIKNDNQLTESLHKYILESARSQKSQNAPENLSQKLSQKLRETQPQTPVKSESKITQKEDSRPTTKQVSRVGTASINNRERSFQPSPKNISNRSTPREMIKQSPQNSGGNIDFNDTIQNQNIESTNIILNNLGGSNIQKNDSVCPSQATSSRPVTQQNLANKEKLPDNKTMSMINQDVAFQEEEKAQEIKI